MIHRIDKYKDAQQPKIYNIIHARAETFYHVFKTMPKFLPVTLAEYHLVEMAMEIPCLCHAPVEAKKRRKPMPCYQIGEEKMLLVIMEEVAKGMDPDSEEASRLIHRLN